MLPEIAAVFSEIGPLTGKEMELVVRSELVKVTSLFLDRYLRVTHRLRQLDGDVAVVDVAAIGDVHWSSQTGNMSNTSWQFNQEIIRRLAVSLGHIAVPIFSVDAYPEYPPQQHVPNMQFLSPRNKWAGLIQRLEGRIHSMLGRLPNPKAQILSTGLAYEEHYVNCSGLYGPLGTLRRSGPAPCLQSGARNPQLRENLRERLHLAARAQMLALLERIDPSLDQAIGDSLHDAWLDMLVDWYPTSLLEGLRDNLARVQASLDLERVSAIIGGELTSDVGILQCLAARLAGKEVIGVQHTAGHYGYIEDLSVVAHPEFFLYDTLVTFGWYRIDEHLPQCMKKSLPCPKLSEKPLASEYLPNECGWPEKRRDILFLSNNFHRFPHVSTCGSARVDFIDDIADSQQEMVRAITKAGLTIDHKPYSERYLDLYPGHYRQLKEVGGLNYRTIAVTQKGLTVELIKTCRIVLWDQIGSGAMECLTAGVPTMIFWQRIYSREVAWAKALIDELESCGIVHTQPDKLAAEIKNYLADPKSWMTDRRRVRAVEAFCRQFAWTEPDWREYWTEYLRRSPLTPGEALG